VPLNCYLEEKAHALQRNSAEQKMKSLANGATKTTLRIIIELFPRWEWQSEPKIPLWGWDIHVSLSKQVSKI
jgi:hypothetical protein